MNFPFTRCQNVSYEEIGQLIKQYDTGKCGTYVRALVAAEEFMENPHKFLNAPQGFELDSKQFSQKNNKKDIIMTESGETTVKTSQNGLSLSNCKSTIPVLGNIKTIF